MTTIEEIDFETKEELLALDKQGREYLNITDENLPPEEIVKIITEHIREKRASQSKLSEEKMYQLGALLGNQYVLGLGWQWKYVIWDNDESTGAVGVLNEDNSLFNNPIGWMFKIMGNDYGDVPFMLSYNMIKVNKIPVYGPGSAIGLY